MAAPVLYTDGGSFGNGRRDQRARMAVFDAGLGRIVVEGDLGPLTNNEAEYEAISAALDYAAERGYRSVEIRSDSLLCVNQIRGVWKIKEPRLAPMAQRARAKLAQLGGAITWVGRDANPAGHHLESRAPTPIAPPAPEPSESAMGYCVQCGTALVERVVDHRQRPTCPRCGWTLFLDPKVAVAAVVSIDDCIVLCRRAIEPGLGRWSFPAGFIDRGEEVRTGLVREVLEETSLEVRLDRLIGVYSEAENPVVLIVYAASAAGMPRPSAEASEVALFRPDELPEMAFSHDHRIVADWQRGRQRMDAAGG